MIQLSLVLRDARRAFIRAETERLGRFLGGGDLGGWMRQYRCECGFRCNAAGDIWDHTQACKGGEP